jgi:multimeric flavodoxin WrbA
MGRLSAPFKAFMDATSHLQYAEKRWAGKIAAGFTDGASRGGDKQNSIRNPCYNVIVDFRESNCMTLRVYHDL